MPSVRAYFKCRPAIAMSTMSMCQPSTVNGSMPLCFAMKSWECVRRSGLPCLWTSGPASNGPEVRVPVSGVRCQRSGGLVSGGPVSGGPVSGAGDPVVLAVVVRCGCSLWLLAVDVRCGCSLWLFAVKSNLL